MRRRLSEKGRLVAGLLYLCVFISSAPVGFYCQSGRPGTGEPVDDTTQRGGPGEDVLRVDTEEVLLPVSVRGLDGAPVNGLTKDDFLVFDNGVRQQISSFNKERVPARIVLLLDASGSVFSQMRFIRDAAKRFIRGLLAEDQLCVMQFADRVELLQDWTPAGSLQQLEKSVDWRYHPGLRTTFYDGLYLAATEQLGRVEGRRIIILLTDGLDTSDKLRASFADALNAVRRAEASVYVVSLTANLRAQIEEKAGNSRLRRLFSVYNPKEVARYLAILDHSEK